MNDDDKELVSHVEALLDKNPAGWGKIYVGELEATRPAVLSLRCKLAKQAAEAREKFRYPPHDPKVKDEPRMTDFDRRTKLESDVAEVVAQYELIKGLEELVKERIEIIKWMETR